MEAMQAMQGMRAMKTMKAMKSKKKSSVAKGRMAKCVVLRGKKAKTTGGLQQTDLMKSKRGKIVSKKAHANGMKLYANIEGWNVALQKARQALGVNGFEAVKKGSLLYMKAKEIYGQRAAVLAA